MKQYDYIRDHRLFRCLLQEAGTGKKNEKILNLYRPHPTINPGVPLPYRWKYNHGINRLIKDLSRNQTI